MLKLADGLLRITVLSTVLGALVACTGPAPDAPARQTVGAAQAAARTQVPLTRRVALDKPGVIADLEFDLPPPDENAWSTLVIGVRIEAMDAKALITHSDLIGQGGLPAKVHLQRMEGPHPMDVPLLRIAADLKERIPVAPDDVIPGVRAAGLDQSMLADAGLLQAGILYETLSFARAAQPAPGRYHLRVELLEPRPLLQGHQADLIIGYNSRAK